MKASYEALTGAELSKLIVRQTATLVQGIPGLNSRLVTFPRLKATVTIRIESFERDTIEREELFDFVENLIASGEQSATSAGVTEYESVVDETVNPPDELREAIGIAPMRPTRNAVGAIEDANPLPLGENLDNIVPPDGESVLGPHGGRVIEQAPLVDRGAVAVGPKLVGDPSASTFRVRRPE